MSGRGEWIEMPSFDTSMVDGDGALVVQEGIPESRVVRERLDERSWVVPHPHTFANVWNRGIRTYWFRFDEALKGSVQDALAMRRDGVIHATLNRRIIPVASLPHVVETDNVRDPVQRKVAQRLLKLVDATPRFQVMKKNLLEATFWGRAGAQLMWGKKRVDGAMATVVIDHYPVHGDKILWKWDGVPGVMVNGAWATGLEIRPSLKKHVEMTTGAFGPALFLRTTALRRRFVIHEFDPTDQDYLYEGDHAGAIRGLGIRGRLWHVWNIRNEVLSWALDAMARIGANGSLVGFYPSGNAAFRENVMTSLTDILREHVTAYPYTPGENVEHLIKQLPVNPTGYDVLKVFADYFDMIIREVILGEQGPGSPVNTRLAAELVEEGRFSIQRADANNLAETLTNDLLIPIMEYNRKELEELIGGPINFGVKLKLQLDKPNSIEDLQSAQLIMGIAAAAGTQVPIDVYSLVEKAGLLPPEEDPMQDQGGVVPDANAQNPTGPGGFEANPRVRTERPTEVQGGDQSRYESDRKLVRYGQFGIGEQAGGMVVGEPRGAVTFKTRPAEKLASVLPKREVAAAPKVSEVVPKTEKAVAPKVSPVQNAPAPRDVTYKTRPKEMKAAAPAVSPAPASPKKVPSAEEAVSLVREAYRKAGGDESKEASLVPLHAIRKHLPGTKEEQDELIGMARKHGAFSLDRHDGRDSSPSDEMQAAAITEGHERETGPTTFHYIQAEGKKPSVAPPAQTPPAPKSEKPFTLKDDRIAPNPRNQQGILFGGESPLDKEVREKHKPHKDLPGQGRMFEDKPEPSAQEQKPEPEFMKETWGHPDDRDEPPDLLADEGKEGGLPLPTAKNPLEIAITSKGASKGAKTSPYRTWANDPSGESFTVESNKVDRNGMTSRYQVYRKGADGLPECDCPDFLKNHAATNPTTREYIPGQEVNPAYFCKHCEGLFGAGLIPTPTRDDIAASHEWWRKASEEG